MVFESSTTVRVGDDTNFDVETVRNSPTEATNQQDQGDYRDELLRLLNEWYAEKRQREQQERECQRNLKRLREFENRPKRLRRKPRWMADYVLT